MEGMKNEESRRQLQSQPGGLGGTSQRAGKLSIPQPVAQPAMRRLVLNLVARRFFSCRIIASEFGLRAPEAAKNGRTPRRIAAGPSRLPERCHTIPS